MLSAEKSSHKGYRIMEGKTPRQSYTEQAHILLAEHINGAGRLFGGTLLAWIDVTAAIAARRHSGHDVTTVCIDNLTFLAPAHINNTVVLAAKVTWVGNTSMEICVESYNEKRGTGEHTLLNRAYAIFVALDENGKPTQVPGLILESDKERKEWEAAELRKDQRKKLRELRISNAEN